jgi:hypothetical protein
MTRHSAGTWLAARSQPTGLSVSHPDGEAKFWLNPEVELAAQTGLEKHVIGEAQQLVEDHRQEIIDAWNEHFPG